MSGTGLSDDDRGQLVVLAGVAVALALVALLGAYLQLGYHADVTTSTVDDHPVRDGQRVLERATRETARTLRGTFEWHERDELVTSIRNRLDVHRRRLAGARVRENVVYRVRYNATAASRWVVDNCPSGRGRDFGPCEARRGVALQRRGTRPTVLAVAFDLTVSTPDGETSVTLIVTAIE